MSKHATLRMTTTGHHPQTGEPEEKTVETEMDYGKIAGALAVFLTLMGLVVGAVTWTANAASKDDLKIVMVEHSEVPHHIKGKAVSAPADIVPKVEENQRQIVALKESDTEIISKIDKQTKQQNYLHARIEFMIETDIYEAQGDSEKRSAIRRAAKKVRARRGHLSESSSVDDPLIGLEGL